MFDQLVFVLDTGFDDLNFDSEVDAQVLDQNGNVIGAGTLHQSGAAKLDDQTQQEYVMALSPPRTYQEIDKFRLSLTPGTTNGEDEWDVQSIDVFGQDSTKPWIYSCLFEGHQNLPRSGGNDWEFKLDTDESTVFEFNKGICAGGD